ncbi:zf-HC2 domain-containing protein [Micromonospora sp. NPDC051296]|uniref:zf-HC2 domain-containing protein n=1 Tax=Micromonospora sp. NPDC051296 TaxID=3155046 RepID=UPI0034494E67
MTGFHVDARVLAAYIEDRLADADAWSVEAHLDRCGACRARITLDEAAMRSVETVAVTLRGPLPAPGRIRRATRWRRIRVLVAAGPAARGAWFVAVAVTGLVTLGLLVSPMAIPPWLLLLVAPALPVLGTAVSYGPWTDPLHELVAGTPHGGLRIVLWRTLAVLAVTAPVALLAGVVTGIGTPAMWPLLCVALTTLTLALGSIVEPGQAAAMVLGGWAVTVLAPTGGWAVVASSGPAWLAVTALAALLVYVRRDQLGRRAA